MPSSVYRFQTAGTDSIVGAQDWTNPNNALADEIAGGSPAAFATCEIVFVDEDQSYWIKVTNPTLVSGDAVPSGATITGVRCHHRGYFTANGTFSHDGVYGLRTNGVRLIVGGSPAGTDYDPDRLWSLTNPLDVQTYQPPADPLWGQSLSVAQVTASNFGFRLKVYADQDTSIPDPGSNSFTARMDFMYVTIDYTGGETPPQRTLTTSVGLGSGTIDPLGSNNYDLNEVVVIEATPDVGYDTQSWTKVATAGGTGVPVSYPDAGTIGDANPDTFSVTMDDSYTVTARFAEFFTLTTSVDPPGGGTVSPANGSKHWRGVVSLSAVPAAGYHFVDWSGDASGTVPAYSLPMSADKSVQANFELDDFTITLTINGQGEVALDPDGAPVGPFDETDSPQEITIAPDTEVEFTATPDANWSFVGWIYQVGAAAPVFSTSNPRNITISADTTVTCAFVFDGWTLTVNIEGNGTVTLDPAGGVYAEGTVVELTAAAASGWTFVGWGQDLSGSANPETILMNGNKVVYAYFEGSGGESAAECRPDRNRWTCES